MYNSVLTIIFVNKESNNSLGHAHFTAEGEVSFKGLIYVPSSPPKTMYDTSGNKVDHLKVIEPPLGGVVDQENSLCSA